MNDLGLRCPRCGETDEINIHAKVWVRITEDGTDADLSVGTGHEWSDDSPALCSGCDYEGVVADFDFSNQGVIRRINDLFAVLHWRAKEDPSLRELAEKITSDLQKLGLAIDEIYYRKQTRKENRR